MPKANKHAEVKPSKYKTSLCQFFVKGETCPFAERCAFAHGEAELQSEDKNVELLKTTGLQRLDRGIPEEKLAGTHISGNSSNGDSADVSVCEMPIPTSAAPSQRTAATPSEEVPSHSRSRADFFASAQPETRPYSPNAAAARQRRPVMVSLPKYNTASDRYDSPYSGQQENYRYAQFSLNAPQYAPPVTISRHPDEPLQPMHWQRPRCACGFAATCRQDRPTTYRHNPYGQLTGHAEYF